MPTPKEREQMRAAAEKATEGARLLNSGDFVGSIAACDEAIRLSPGQLGASRTREEALQKYKPQDYVNEFILTMARSHGLNATLDPGEVDEVYVDEGSPSIGAILRPISQQDTGYLIEITAWAYFEDWEISDNFAGTAESFLEAVKDGLNKSLGAFHVFLSAFFGVADDSVTVEKWQINGKDWAVTIGAIGEVAIDGNEANFPIDLLPKIESLVKQRQLVGPIHSLSVFYGSFDNKVVCEVMWDNEPWELAQQKIASLGWKKGSEYYSVRTLIVFQPEEGAPSA